MRKLLTALGLLVAIGLAVGLSAQEGKPINAKCPVKGEPAKADVTTTFQGKVIGFCWDGCRGKFTANPAQYVANLPELKGGAKPEGKAPDKPVNEKCPINGEDVNPQITASVQGKLVGFCSRACFNKFARAPGEYIAGIPELGGKKPGEKKPDAKADSKPAASGPCECKKVVKGYYCTMCKRELGPDDIRGALCKRCETKPATIEYCLKSTPPVYVADCHPNKKSDKPISWWGKMYKTPTVVEDRARISYECETCGAKADMESEVKHKPDCKPKALGGGLKKVCAKSGKAPHVSDEK